MADVTAQITATRNAYNALFSKTETAISDLKAVAAGSISLNSPQYGAAVSGAPSVTSAGGGVLSWSAQGGGDVTDTQTGDRPWQVDKGGDVTAVPNTHIQFDPAFKLQFDDRDDLVEAMQLEQFSYQSEFFDGFLDERIRLWIESEGLFLAQGVQDALFAKMRERDRITLAESLQATNRLQAQRGFPVPNDMLMAARADVIHKHSALQNDRNAEVTALTAEKSLQEKLEAVRSGVQMEEIRSRFKLEYNRLYFNVLDYIVKREELRLRTELAEIDTMVKSLELDFRLSDANAKIEGDYLTRKQQKDMELLRSDVAKYERLLRASIENSRNGLEVDKLGLGAASESAKLGDSSAERLLKAAIETAKHTTEFAQFDHQGRIKDVDAAVAGMTAYVNAWSKAMEARMTAAAAAVNFYSNAALGTSGQINIVTSQS